MSVVRIQPKVKRVADRAAKRCPRTPAQKQANKLKPYFVPLR